MKPSTSFILKHDKRIHELYEALEKLGNKRNSTYYKLKARLDELRIVDDWLFEEYQFHDAIPQVLNANMFEGPAKAGLFFRKNVWPEMYGHPELYGGKNPPESNYWIDFALWLCAPSGKVWMKKDGKKMYTAEDVKAKMME